MGNRKNFLIIGVMAAILLFAVWTIAGNPLFPAEAFTGLGLMPLAAGSVVDMEEIKRLIDTQGESLKKWKETQGAQIEGLASSVEGLAKKAGRPTGLVGEPSASNERSESWIDVKSQSPIPVLSHGQSVIQSKGDAPNLGRVLRGLVMGGRASDAKALDVERKALGISSNPAGGFTVDGTLAGEWIDLMRAQMVLSQAGARTIPMQTGELTLARVTGDPTISWHGENAAIAGAEPTFGAVSLRAKTVVCLVKMSLELSQDSANIEQILSSTITSAMANAIDSAGISGVTVDAGAAPSGVLSLANRNKVLAIGAPTTWDFVVDGMYDLMADNVSMDRIGALVAHPALWKKMRKLKTGITNDNTPLTMPAEVAALPKLWTTAAPLAGGNTATGIIADWRDLLFGVRQDITVRVLQETFMGSNLQIAMLAYARVDFAATRQESFCTLEGITVA